jgi:hypothetical protein
MPSDKPLQLLAVKDMGLAAGIALKEVCAYPLLVSGDSVSYVNNPSILAQLFSEGSYEILSSVRFIASIIDLLCSLRSTAE